MAQKKALDNIVETLTTYRMYDIDANGRHLLGWVDKSIGLTRHQAIIALIDAISNNRQKEGVHVC